MDTARLKREMMTLWKDTFQDSDDYIALVFDNYFNPEYVEFEERDNHIVAALMGIPYRFAKGDRKRGEQKSSSTAAEMQTLSGLYLCGLATRPEFRRQGIMHNLMDKINLKAYKRKFDFSFLIPASDDLADYYFRMGYVDCFKRIADRYSSVHNFFEGEEDLKNVNIEPNKIYANSDCSLRYSVYEISNLDDKVLVKIDEFLKRNLCSNCYFDIDRSLIDVGIILRENLISGGRNVVVEDCCGKSIVAICIFNVNNNSGVVIPHLYFNDRFSKRLLMQFVKQQYLNFPLIIYKYPEEEKRKLIWSPYNLKYETENNEHTVVWNEEEIYEVNSHPQNYGMARLLRASEILKFLNNDRGVTEFSILVKEDFSKSEYIYIKDGSGIRRMLVVGETADGYSVKNVDSSSSIAYSECSDDCISGVYKIPKDGITRLSMPQLSEIIWRNRKVNDLVEDAFGLPRISINMSYLLD